MAAKGVDGPPPVLKSTLGLNFLYDPSGTIAVDIVAVHGLGGDACKTWTGNDKLWLRDLLPQSLDESQVQGTSSTYILYSLLPRRLTLTARIMTLSYDVNILTKATNQRTFTFAEDHLSSVNDSRLGPAKAWPLIFVSHSLGGTVVKKALLIAQARPYQWRDLLHSVRHLIFFGTPHQGAASTANFLRGLRNALGFAKCSSPLKELQLWSNPLIEGNALFAEVSSEFTITIFFEKEKTHGINIAEEGSAPIYKRVAARLSAEVHNIASPEAESAHEERVIHLLAMRYFPHVLQRNQIQPFRVTHNFQVPNILTSFFIGRDKELRNLRDLLGDNTNRMRTAAIYGMYGISKTQLLVKYADMYSELYDYVFYFPSHNQASIDEGFNHAARALRLPRLPHEAQNYEREDVQQLLREIKKWLIIWDNVKDIDRIKKNLSFPWRGSVILAARDPSVAKAVVHTELTMELTPLGEEEATTQFIRYSRLPVTLDTKIAAEELISYPEGIPQIICNLPGFALSHKLDAAAVLLKLQCHDDLCLAPQSKGQCDICECLHKKVESLLLQSKKSDRMAPTLFHLLCLTGPSSCSLEVFEKARTHLWASIEGSNPHFITSIVRVAGGFVDYRKILPCYLPEEEGIGADNEVEAIKAKIMLLYGMFDPIVRPQIGSDVLITSGLARKTGSGNCLFHGLSRSLRGIICSPSTAMKCLVFHGQG